MEKFFWRTLRSEVKMKLRELVSMLKQKKRIFNIFPRHAIIIFKNEKKQSNFFASQIRSNCRGYRYSVRAVVG